MRRARTGGFSAHQKTVESDIKGAVEEIVLYCIVLLAK